MGFQRDRDPVAKSAGHPSAEYLKQPGQSRRYSHGSHHGENQSGVRRYPASANSFSHNANSASGIAWHNVRMTANTTSRGSWV